MNEYIPEPMDTVLVESLWKDFDVTRKPSREMFCWGSTVNGELGLGGIEEEQIMCPRELQFSKSMLIKQVACGSNHTVVVTNDGSLYSCGNNDYGQLGHEKARKKLERIESLEQQTIIQASCGSSHSLAVNEWGQVFSWGSDSHGQLGMGKGIDVIQVPKIIKPLATTHVVQVTAGSNHCLALTNKGELYSWGCNEYGQLGIGVTSPVLYEPVAIKSLCGIPVAAIACGGNHSFVVSRSGAVYGWGKNAFGQVGVGDNTNKQFPNQLKTLRSVRVTYVACGEDFSVFLTQDGGVFTCGAGMYGQLGHGSTSNEFVPRKVMELMGSTVTQVTCGRRHTLVLVPSRGRVYGFGLGVAGQLGIKAARSYSTPQVVLGPWISPNGVALIEPGAADIISSYSKDCVVKRIYAGGDHSFAVVTQKKDNVPPDDCRELNSKTQILSLTRAAVESLEKVPAGSVLDQDLMTYIENVFSSQACINCSFLLPNNEHYCCNSRNHGVNLAEAEDCFSVVGRLPNNSIKSLILNSVSEFLIPTLSCTPPDVETLRIYLLLPLYHEFSNPKHYLKLHNPFGHAILNLKPEPDKILAIWWSQTSQHYFERLVIVYKEVISYLLVKLCEKKKNYHSEHDLFVSLQILQKLNKLNNNATDLKVPYDSFYLPELAEWIDIRSDYLHWLTERDTTVPRVYFCNYPFLFDAHAKTMLLQVDQSLQMQTAINLAAREAVTSMFFSPAAAREITPHLELVVSRNNIVQDTIRELSLNPSDLKKPLKIKFLGEEAEDAGGVTKEFFLLILREVLDPKYGMFAHYEETRTIWFTAESFEDEGMYHLIGLLCGLAIYNFIIIELPFPLVLYKKLLREKVCLQDLRGLSPSLAKSLQDVLDYQGDDIQEVFGLSFEISVEFFGEAKIYPLKPNGSNIPVTQENKAEFVDLYVDHILNTGVEKHFSGFYNGFHKVCGGRVLELFHSHELMAVVVGNENYNWQEFEEHAEYKNGYTASDPTIRYFWEVFHELSLEEKKMFLLFLTGSDRVPLQGMKALKIYIQPTADDKFLPVAHTCFNLLDLPRYGTKEKLRYKLLQAIQQTHGFSLV